MRSHRLFVCAQLRTPVLRGVNVICGGMASPRRLGVEASPLLRQNRTLCGRLLTRDCPTLRPKTWRSRVLKGRH